MHKDVQPLTCNILNRYEHTFNNLEYIETKEEKEAYREISNQYLGMIAGGHKVFLIQPYIKWGKDKKRNTMPELQMAESVALIESLSNWSVADKMYAPLLSFQRKSLLGSGGLQNLKDKIKRSAIDITAVFISTNLLKYVQILELQNILELPVFDRYSIVIHIFRQHARTPEAQLQVALAELPYIWKKMGEVDQKSGHINLLEIRRKLLRARESKLKKSLQKLKIFRQESRKRRKAYELPSIAIVGYTNAGKTSLIKVLTGDTNLKPRNQLFATLDTITYEGFLPSRQKVLYVDTIGFIQDVPEMLIEPFVVTLEDAMDSDVIIHIYDVSHPDAKAQFQHVQEIVRPMLNERQPIIYVANKCDLAEDLSIIEDSIAISCKELSGIEELKLKLEKELLKTTGRSVRRIRVESGSLAASWLYKWTTVINSEPDATNPQYMIFEVIASDNTIREFKQFLKE